VLVGLGIERLGSKFALIAREKTCMHGDFRYVYRFLWSVRAGLERIAAFNDENLVSANG
jgi:hypothetical protein